MPLDRVWELRAGGFESNPEDVWVGIREQSPLASVGEVDGLLRPLETRTMRLRWRADIGLAAILVDEQGHVWYVNETLEVPYPRRTFLDVGCSRYGYAGVTAEIPERANMDFLPPAGYTLANRSGVPVQVIRIGDSQEDFDATGGLGYQRFNILASEPGDTGSFPLQRSGNHAPPNLYRYIRASLRRPGREPLDGYLCEAPFQSGGEHAFFVLDPEPFTTSDAWGARGWSVPPGAAVAPTNELAAGDFIVIASRPV